MQSAKEKLKDMGSAAKEHVDIYNAKVEEKVEKAAARTEEEKKMVHERRKAKEAEAKMELHEAKAKHAAEKQHTKQSHLYGHHEPAMVGHHHHGYNEPLAGAHQPVGTAATQPAVVGAQGQYAHQPVGTVPTQPLMGTQPPVVGAHQPVGNAAPMAGGTVPTNYPLGGQTTQHKYM